MPDQLHVDDTLHNGPKLLKSYLQFVLDVSKGHYEPFKQVSTAKKFTGRLKEEIKEWASGKWAEYRVEENRLPFYDLTVRLNNRTIGAILTDDSYYHQSLSAKADHALTPHLLELKHWPFLRVYSRNFWQDPDKFFNEISKFMNR